MANEVPIQKTKVFRVKLDLDKGVAFEEQCKNDDSNVNAKLKELIDSHLTKQKKFFLSGKNKIKYDRTKNSFSWLIELDSGKEVSVMKNLSDDFLKNLNQEINKSLQERNDWVHQSKEDSVDVPGDLVGGEE